MSKRIPLRFGTSLNLGRISYTISDVIASGSSCIAYTAQRELSGSERETGLPTVPAVIKEFYPAVLSDYILRDGAGLAVLAKGQKRYNDLCRQFVQGAVNQRSFFIGDSNHSLPLSKIAAANNTVYLTVDSMQGDVLENVRDCFNLYEISRVMISLCSAVQSLHDAGKLHLDIKPSNIYVFEWEQCENPRVALLDFDTVTAMDEIRNSEIPFSDGWSPYEQVQGSKEKISYATDIYAIGAVLYWLISGEKVTDEILDSVKRNKFDFLDAFPVLKNKRSARGDICEILAATLKRDPLERVQCIGDLM